ncbi:MAG: ROK family protein [Clostridia bacterium]|nr:ROK family protein [Clostridia bacterium]
MTSKIKSGKPGLLKKINKGLILKLLLKEKEISRSQLAKATGLALPSIMRLVDELISEQLVSEIGKGESSGGRKPAMLTLNGDAMYFIGVEIAIDTTVVLTNMLGDVMGMKKSKQMAFDSPEKMLHTIVFYIEELILEHHIHQDKLGGIGVGTPGMGFKHLREVHHSVLKGWESIDVKKWLSEYLPYPIVVDNIARTRTLSELWFGYGNVYDDFIYVFVDQGVGCGLVKDGKIQVGHDTVSGEFGHSIVTVEGRPCYCGREGCLEMYVSAGAILNRIEEKYHEKYQSLDAVSSSKMFPEVYDEVKTYLGIGLSNLINIINPEALILGGEVIKSHMASLEDLKEIVETYTFNQKAIHTQLHLAKTLDQEAALGSVALIFNHIFEM